MCGSEPQRLLSSYLDGTISKGLGEPLHRRATKNVSTAGPAREPGAFEAILVYPEHSYLRRQRLTGNPSFAAAPLGALMRPEQSDRAVFRSFRVRPRFSSPERNRLNFNVSLLSSLV
jgi:hypothetical protein